MCHAITPSRRHATVHTKRGKSWKPQINGKLPQILRDRKLWNRFIYFSGTEWNCYQSKHNIQTMSSTWQIWQRATTCLHFQIKFATKIYKAFLFYTINAAPWFCLLGFRGIFQRSAIPSFVISGVSVFPSFRRSTIPPFHRSTVPPFHRSTLPPFYRSTVRSFGLLGSPLRECDQQRMPGGFPGVDVERRIDWYLDFDNLLLINVAFSRCSVQLRAAARKKARRFAPQLTEGLEEALINDIQPFCYWVKFLLFNVVNNWIQDITLHSCKHVPERI